MKNKRTIITVLVVAVALIVIAYFVNENSVQVSKVNIINDVPTDGAKLAIGIDPEENWVHYAYHIIRTSPQYAVWIEDIDGNFIGTIYVTKKTFDWVNNSAGKNPERLEALPYWWHKQKSVKITDAMTSATPKSDIHIQNMISGCPQWVVIKLEINNSLDYNEYYTEDGRNGTVYSATSGQPALVYAAVVDLSAKPSRYDLKIVGHSSPDGSDGKLYTDTSHVTTAMKIVRAATLEVK